MKNAEAVLREVKDLSQKTEETLTVLEAARIAEEVRDERLGGGGRVLMSFVAVVVGP